MTKIYPEIYPEIYHLKNLQVIEISGADSFKFLQGLITNDVNKTLNEEIIYTAMLNSNGRFLYDFFLSYNQHNQSIILICSQKYHHDLIKKLNFFRLKSAVKISPAVDINVLYAPKKNELENELEKFKGNYQIFKDPRNQAMGVFCLVDHQDISKLAIDDNLFAYHCTRINNLICQGEFDLISEKSFIQEFAFDKINAIDYNKGCYVGQEIIARSYHRGEIRKKIINLEIDLLENDIFKQKLFNLVNNQDLSTKKPNYYFFDCQNSLKISNCNQEIGQLLSLIFDEKKCLALGQIKLSENLKLENLNNDLIIEQINISSAKINF